MSHDFLGLISMNESEYLISNAVASATIGWPNFKILIIDTLIKGIYEIDSNFLEIMLIVKFILALTSLYWIYKLVSNIEFTYKRHSSLIFDNYMSNLIATGIIIFVLATLVRWIIF